MSEKESWEGDQCQTTWSSFTNKVLLSVNLRKGLLNLGVSSLLLYYFPCLFSSYTLSLSRFP